MWSGKYLKWKCYDDDYDDDDDDDQVNNDDNKSYDDKSYDDDDDDKRIFHFVLADREERGSWSGIDHPHHPIMAQSMSQLMFWIQT